MRNARVSVDLDVRDAGNAQTAADSGAHLPERSGVSQVLAWSAVPLHFFKKGGRDRGFIHNKRLFPTVGAIGARRAFYVS